MRNGRDGRAGPDREQLINTISTLKELEEMLLILERESEQLLNQRLTDSARKTLLTAHEAACKLLKIVRSLIPQTVYQLDEYLAGQKIIGEVDYDGGG